MAEQVYSWTRFWHNPYIQPRLEDGLLVNPLGEYGHIFNPDVVDFAAIRDTQCLILLGEAGLGKSFALKNDLSALSVEHGQMGDSRLDVDLRSVGSDTMVMRKIFDTPEFRRLIDENMRLTLFLDSFDECTLRVGTLVPLLLDEFSKLDQEKLRNHLRIRIASRPSSWNTELGNGLQMLWQEGYAAYRLAPLRREDVLAAASQNGLQAEEFIRTVLDKRVGPLAANPMTLTFLLEEFAQREALPSSMLELYRAGCMRLCVEPKKERRTGQIGFTTNVEQRFAIAARIAAVTMLAGRDSIWQGGDPLDGSTQDVSVNDVVGGTELSEDDAVVVTEASVREALSTSLFASRGPDLVGWGHISYAEFLAAAYLRERDMSITQILSLLRVPGDPQQRIVPQLAGVASWLASLIGDLFAEIAQTDPLVLINADLDDVAETAKVAYIDLLFERLADGRISPYEIGYRRDYAKLDHAEISSQLRPYIADIRRDLVVRNAAVDIADACHVTDLGGDLLNIVQSSVEDLDLRVNAATAIARIGSSSDKEGLKGIALDGDSNDPAMKLRAACLFATWPTLLTANELFDHLPIPPRDGSRSLLDQFITSDLGPGLSNQDLPAALLWLARLDEHIDLQYTLEVLNDDIVTRAWTVPASPELTRALATLAVARSRVHSSLVSSRNHSEFSKAVDGDPLRKREVLLAVLQQISPDKGEVASHVYASIPLARPDDVEWLVSTLKSTSHYKVRRSISSAIAMIINWTDVSAVDVALTAAKRSVLAKYLEPLIKPVVLHSNEAKEMKRSFQEWEKWRKRDEDQPKKSGRLTPSPANRVKFALDKCETESIDWWWRLTQEMTLEPTSVKYSDPLDTKLSLSPGWSRANAATRARITAAAIAYVSTRSSKPEEWFGQNLIYWPAVAGYSALRLLMEVDAAFVTSFDKAGWSNWIPILIALPHRNSFDDDDWSAQTSLLTCAYKSNSDDVSQWLVDQVLEENRAHNNVWILQSLRFAGDERLWDRLSDELSNPGLSLSSYRVLLRWLLGVGSAKASAHALAVSQSEPSTDHDIDRFVVALDGLTYLGRTDDWPSVWQAIIDRPDIASRFIYAISNRGDRFGEKITQRLGLTELVDLYIYLVRLFPLEDDPKHDGIQSITPRDMISSFRNGILNHIAKHSTVEARDALKRIHAEFPQFDWLPRVIREAEAQLHCLTWVPVSPSQVLQLTRSRKLRIIRSSDDLHQLLEESIGRFERELQGVPPRAVSAWNEVSSKKYRPKTENEFSDLLVLHFNNDISGRAVVINREVEIRRGYSSVGQRTDIHVQAISKGSSSDQPEVIGVIVEVKGNWNDEVTTGLEEQLAKRYLTTIGWTHGLFLVAWFNCSAWDTSDRKYKKAIKRDQEELGALLQSQTAIVRDLGFVITYRIINAALP